MSVKKLDQTALNAWVDGLIAKEKVFGVQAKDDKFAYGELKNASDLRLDYDVTILPPKKYFLPQTEDIVRFHRKGEFEPILEWDPFIVIGVHPYDVEAIKQMDTIFTKDHYDAHYMTRRKHATIIAVDVETPSENVFAGCMGTAVVQDGFDILLTKIDGTYVAEAKTEKGEKLLAEANGTEATQEDLAKREEVWAKNKKALRKHELHCAPADLPVLLEKSYNSPLWEELAERCFACGSCNLVCPTCYCFDVQDDVDWNMETGKRYRSWDGCLLKDFATVAGEHNFRGNRAERIRHRIYRKGKYIAERIGEIACVGCGRCINACVPDVANPVTIYNRLLEEQS